MSFTGDPVVAMDTVWDTQVPVGTTASSTYTSSLSGAVTCGVAFVAPASGKVLIHNAMQMQASGGNSFATVRVRTGGVVGSGTDVLAASDDEALIAGVGVLVRAGVIVPVPGLTPGNTYNAQVLYRNDTSSTLTTTRKKLVVEPQT